MLLNEVLKNVVPYKYSEAEDAYVFDIGDIHYQAIFTAGWVDSANEFIDSWIDFADQYMTDELEKMFEGGKTVIAFEFNAIKKGEERTNKLSGYGNAFQVLATVLNIIDKHRGTNFSDVVILVSAAKNEPSRVKLYKRLVSQYKGKVFPYETRKDFNWLLD